MLASPLLGKLSKSTSPKARRELAQKNRIGTKALNFSSHLASGAQGSLYQQQADYILLFINNPGCHACTETIDALKTHLSSTDFWDKNQQSPTLTKSWTEWRKTPE